MPKIDQNVLDKLTSMDADWPEEGRAAPDLPPVPDAEPLQREQPRGEGRDAQGDAGGTEDQVAHTR